MLDKTVTLRLDTQTYQDLVNLAATKQQETNSVYAISDIIREAIEDLTKPSKIGNLKNSNRYQPIGRKILKEDILKDSITMPKYKRDISVKSYTIPKRGEIPENFIGNEELFVPLFRIASNPTWDIDEENEEVIKRAIEYAEESIDKDEDKEVFCLLNASTSHLNFKDKPLDNWGGSSDHIIITEKPSYEDFTTACTKLLEHKLSVENIIIHPQNRILTFDILEKIKGFTVNVLESLFCPKDTIYFTASPEFVGVMPIKKNLAILDDKDPQKFRNGKVIYRTLGMSIINDYAISKIVIEENLKSNFSDSFPKEIISL